MGMTMKTLREVTLNFVRLDFDFVRNDIDAVLDNWESIAVAPHSVRDDFGFCAERHWVHQQTLGPLRRCLGRHAEEPWRTLFMFGMTLGFAKNQRRLTSGPAWSGMCAMTLGLLRILCG